MSLDPIPAAEPEESFNVLATNLQKEFEKEIEALISRVPQSKRAFKREEEITFQHAWPAVNKGVQAIDFIHDDLRSRLDEMNKLLSSAGDKILKCLSAKGDLGAERFQFLLENSGSFENLAYSAARLEKLISETRAKILKEREYEIECAIPKCKTICNSALSFLYQNTPLSQENEEKAELIVSRAIDYVEKFKGKLFDLVNQVRGATEESKDNAKKIQDKFGNEFENMTLSIQSMLKHSKKNFTE